MAIVKCTIRQFLLLNKLFKKITFDLIGSEKSQLATVSSFRYSMLHHDK